VAYKCLDCGHIFECGEEAKWEESRGEYWGSSCSEQMSGCPICKGSYEETTRCAACGSEHLEDELNGGVCNDCIDTYRRDFRACYELSVGDNMEIKINALLGTLFTPSEIEQILKEHIEKNCKDIDCSEYIDLDIWYFGEKIAEEVRNNENRKVKSL